MGDPELAKRIKNAMSMHGITMDHLLLDQVLDHYTYPELARMVERGMVSLADLRDLSQAIGCTMADLIGTTRPVRVSCHLDGRGCIREVQAADGTWCRA